MRDIAVLYVEDCPNVSVVVGYLVDCDIDPLTVRMVLVGSGPIPGGIAGSPTVLIDGVNPVGISGDGFDVSCSLRMPTAEQLRIALGNGARSSDSTEPSSGEVRVLSAPVA